MNQFEYTTMEFGSGLILVRKFHNRVNVNDIIASWEYLIDNNMLNEKFLGVINDLQDANLEMNQDCFHQLISYMKMKPVFLRIKLAVICDTPDKILFPTIGEHMVKELRIKPFSTFDAAVQWILKP